MGADLEDFTLLAAVLSAEDHNGIACFDMHFYSFTVTSLKHFGAREDLKIIALFAKLLPPARKYGLLRVFLASLIITAALSSRTDVSSVVTTKALCGSDDDSFNYIALFEPHRRGAAFLTDATTTSPILAYPAGTTESTRMHIAPLHAGIVSSLGNSVAVSQCFPPRNKELAFSIISTTRHLCSGKGRVCHNT